jgi:hypothetical protein
LQVSAALTVFGLLLDACGEWQVTQPATFFLKCGVCRWLCRAFGDY